jgi:hypothetical protein
MNKITGRVLEVTSREAGGRTYKTLILQREPSDDYERSHEDRVVIPLDVSPVAKIGPEAMSVGAVVEVEFRLTGRAYNGRRYLSAVALCADVVDAPPAQPPPVQDDPPADTTDNLPF